MPKVIHIKTESEQKPLSKLQKQFNNYIKKISSLKIEIEETKKVLEIVNTAVAQDFAPLEKKEYEIRVEIIKTLDNWAEKAKFTKKEKETLSEYIATESFSIIDMGHEELKPIYEKYAEMSFEEANQEANETTADMMKDIFGMMGIEIDDDADVSDPAKFQAYMQEKMEKKEIEQFEQERTKTKSKKQLEKEEKKQLAESQLSQSIKEIYKKLVKEFHPDLEQDENEKIRKTAVMTRITEAYERNDLLSLLQLQLEYEQINEENINSLADEKLKHYNKVLKEQIDTLQSEAYFLNGNGNPMHPFTRLEIYSTDMWFVKIRIEKEIKRLKNLNKTLEKDLKTLKTSFDAVKEWIKLIRKSAKEMDFDMDFMKMFR